MLALLLSLFLLIPSLAWPATVDLKWDASSNATGYEIESAPDPKVGPWSLAASVASAGACPSTGTVCTHSLSNVSETGVIYFRLTSVNAVGKTSRMEAGAWFCFSCKPPDPASGAGVK